MTLKISCINGNERTERRFKSLVCDEWQLKMTARPRPRPAGYYNLSANASKYNNIAEIL
jgi:hypothetical protein